MPEPVSPADTIRLMLEGGDFCSYCARPVATEQDWDEFPEGGGEHLCWDGGDAGCTDAGAITLRRDDVVALLAVGERDKAELSGLRIEFGEWVSAIHEAFDGREVDPQSDGPERIRRLVVERQQAEERGERDRRQIAQLTEAAEGYRDALAFIAADPAKYGSLGMDGARQVAANALRGQGPTGLTFNPAVLAGEEDAGDG